MHTYLSLFSGAGGGDMAMDAAGLRCVGQIEIDRHCQKVLARHWPNVPKWSDICDVNGADLEPADVVLFGSPCQDLSVAGKRAGFDADRSSRSSLYFEAIRVIGEMQHATQFQFPRVAIWENVPGALNSNAGADFAAALTELAYARAYLIEWCVVDARHWLPQRRRRVFVAAVFDSGVASRCPDPLFPITASCRRDPQESDTQIEDTAGTLAGGSGKPRGFRNDLDSHGAYIPMQLPADSEVQWSIPDVSPTIDASFAKQQSMTLQSAANGHLLHTSMATEHAQTQLIADYVGTLAPGSHPGGVNGQDAYTGQLIISQQPAIDHPSADDAQVFRETAIGEYVNDGTASTVSARDYKSATDLITCTQHEHAATGAGIVPISDARGTSTRGNGSGLGQIGDPMFTLTALEVHGIAALPSDSDHTMSTGNSVLSIDTEFGSNAGVFTDETPPVKSTAQLPAIIMPAAVRRLLPIECERLQGWPDDHTRFDQHDRELPDAARYRMIGNGIATPALRWIIDQITPHL